MAGYGYLAAAAHFAAESLTGTNANASAADDFANSVDAVVNCIDPEIEGSLRPLGQTSRYADHSLE